MKITANQLMPLVLHFIGHHFGEGDLESFKKYFALSEIDHEEDPLVKAGGMQAMLTSFLKNNKKALKKFKEHHDKDAEAAVSGKRRRRASSAVSDAVSEEKVAKKSKKRQRTSSINSITSVASDRKTRQKKAEVVLPAPGEVKDVVFKRIDETLFEGKITENFADCSFEAKARYGQGGDTYGSWSNDKLKVTQGASFIKMKNKMKNRNTHASGTFNASTVNSVRF